MKLIGFSSRSTKMDIVRSGLAGAVVAIVVTASALAFASGPSEVDKAVFQIEQVDARLKAAPSMVATVTKAAAERGNAEASKLAPILEMAVRASFRAPEMGAEVLDSLAEVDDGNVDPNALSKAAAAFVDGRKKIEQMYKTQDQAVAKEIEARIASADDGPRISRLADLMASPELAAEMALSAQVMFASLEAASNGNIDELASAPQEKLKSELQGVVTSLRNRAENEKPLAKDTASTDEKARITFALATISKENLAALEGFYRSSVGRAKTEALAESFRKTSDQANTKMLGEYFTGLADYFKSNPRSQQQ